MAQSRMIPMTAIVLFLSSYAADAQGIPVIDQSAIAKQIESITQLKSQLDALNQQLQQAQQLYGSLNKLTNMADVASLLNDPAIRKALPGTFLPSKACSGAQVQARLAMPPQSS